VDEQRVFTAIAKEESVGELVVLLVFGHGKWLITRSIHEWLRCIAAITSPELLIGGVVSHQSKNMSASPSYSLNSDLRDIRM
jgi:hypothetical protein